jgi:hypothetical protein
MRKVVGLLFAVSLLLPVGLVAAGPASAAAAKLPTCTKLKGVQKYAPALPHLGLTTTVTSKVTVNVTTSGCSGGGVTGSTNTSAYSYTGNCMTLITHKGAIKGTAAVKWSNGKTSSMTTALTTTSKPGVNPVLATLVAKVTKGQFIGTTSTEKLKITLPTGACLKIGLSGNTFVNLGSFSYK